MSTATTDPAIEEWAQFLRALAEISPADYPLGSSESRAAARALVSERTMLSAADTDALTLYRAGHWLSTEELRPLEATAVYQRGKELQLRLFGSTGEEYEGDDPLCQRKDSARRHFVTLAAGGDWTRRGRKRARWLAVNSAGEDFLR